MTTIVICHGAFRGGWAWRVGRPLSALGHDVLTPTLTGLGERHRYARPLVGLTTHIDDLADLLFHGT